MWKVNAERSFRQDHRHFFNIQLPYPAKNVSEWLP